MFTLKRSAHSTFALFVFVTIWRDMCLYINDYGWYAECSAIIQKNEQVLYPCLIKSFDLSFTTTITSQCPKTHLTSTFVFVCTSFDLYSC